MLQLSNINSFEELPTNYQQAIDDFIATGNKTEAYRKYIAKGKGNKNSDSTNACMIFNNANVLQVIRERKDYLLGLQQLTANEIINNIKNIALGNVPDQYSDKTAVKDQLEANKLLAKIAGVLDESNKTQVNVGIQFVDDIKE